MGSKAWATYLLFSLVFALPPTTRAFVGLVTSVDDEISMIVAAAHIMCTCSLHFNLNIDCTAKLFFQ